MAGASSPDPNSPLGTTVTAAGAIFRVWAPRAKAVYVSGDFNDWKQNSASQLTETAGQWSIFIPGLKDGDEYLFYVDGQGTDGYKRDPRARLLTFEPSFPFANCVLRDPSRFPWHETAFQPPAFNDLIIYELHVGTYSIATGNNDGRFLDVALKVPYLAALGVTAVELLPIQEFETSTSQGYNGTDLYSPENQYGESVEQNLQSYFDQINAFLVSAGQAAYSGIDVLRGSDNQLRALVDLCHVYGIAVLFDVVYNHAGGPFDDNSMWFLDRMPEGDNNDSLYFTDQGFVGGLVFAYWNRDVQQFLVDNALSFYREYRIDGFRFDEVSTMDHFGGWQTCQFITSMLHAANPKNVQIAEYWPVNDYVVKNTSAGGAGFDATWNDSLRDAIHAAIGAASAGAAASVNMDAIAAAIQNSSLDNRWRAVQSVEDHDLVYVGRSSRIARLADGSNSRSWYARSRSRVALGLVLTAPGIPMLFMGQEFLEDKQWNDSPDPANLIWWTGLDEGDKSMSDFLRFTRELIAVRRKQPALSGEGCQVIHVHNLNRVLAFQRWVEGVGRDVMVIANLAESTYYNYQIGFPSGGFWIEVFNSDVYDNWVNPIVAGNGNGVTADGTPMHGLSTSARLVLPANGLVVFAKDQGN